MAEQARKGLAEQTIRTPDGRTLLFSCYLRQDGASIRHGPFREVASNGVVLSEGLFEDGTEAGFWIDRHPNGVVAAQGNYCGGLEAGWWRFWREDGFEEEPILYRDGQPVVA